MFWRMSLPDRPAKPVGGDQRALSTPVLGMAAALFGAAWLLPMHELPWPAFASDAIAAFVLLSLAAVLLLRSGGHQLWHGLPVAVLASMAVVVAQYASGLIAQFGVAWIVLAYLAGLLLALLTGARWARAGGDHALDFLFGTVLIGAVASLALQIYQVIDLDFLGKWVQRPLNPRFYANVAQPNLLATLLLLGLLGLGWFHHRHKLPGWLAAPAAFSLVLGLALTASRTAWLGFVLIGIGMLLYRRFDCLRRLLPWFLGLGLLYLIFASALPAVLEWTPWRGQAAHRALLDQSRLRLWNLFYHALAERPWFGYGWGQVGHAQFDAPLERMYPGVNANHAHNLLLDLILQNGWIIGSILILVLVWWGVRALLSVRRPADVLALMFVAVVFNHGMLEFPLEYGYFLWPTGLMMGVINERLGFPVMARLPKWILGGMLAAAFALWYLTTRHYLVVESNYYKRSLELSGFSGMYDAGSLNRTNVISQWVDFIDLTYVQPADAHSPEDIVRALRVMKSTPSALAALKIAQMHAFAGEADQAAYWLRVLCRMNSQSACASMKASWRADATRWEQLKSIPWPDD